MVVLVRVMKTVNCRQSSLRGRNVGLKSPMVQFDSGGWHDSINCRNVFVGGRKRGGHEHPVCGAKQGNHNGSLLTMVRATLCGLDLAFGESYWTLNSVTPMKRWTQKAKKQLIRDSVEAAIEVFGLQGWQITLVFDNKVEFRATCEAEPRYFTAKLTFAPRRIEIFECVEFGIHEPAHILTWEVAGMLERAAGDDPQAIEDAEEAYERLTTAIGHIAFPFVIKKLEEAGKLPVEAKEMPGIIEERNKKQRKTVDLTKPVEPVTIGA